MKQQQTTTTRFSPIELKDAKTKIDLYLTKLTINNNGPHTKSQKICHLATQTFLKFADHDQFSKQIYQKLKIVIIDKKCYYGLYLLDILMKNNKLFLKYTKKQLDKFFKIIYEKVHSQPKNSIKIQCLKAMVRTWGVIYGQKYQENVQKWLESRYKQNLNLNDRNQQLFKQSYQKYKTNNNNNSKSTGGTKLQMLLSQIDQEDNMQKLELLEALKD